MGSTKGVRWPTSCLVLSRLAVCGRGRGGPAAGPRGEDACGCARGPATAPAAGPRGEDGADGVGHNLEDDRVEDVGRGGERQAELEIGLGGCGVGEGLGGGAPRLPRARDRWSGAELAATRVPANKKKDPRLDGCHYPQKRQRA